MTISILCLSGGELCLQGLVGIIASTYFSLSVCLSLAEVGGVRRRASEGTWREAFRCDDDEVSSGTSGRDETKFTPVTNSSAHNGIYLLICSLLFRILHHMNLSIWAYIIAYF